MLTSRGGVKGWFLEGNNWCVKDGNVLPGSTITLGLSQTAEPLVDGGTLFLSDNAGDSGSGFDWGKIKVYKKGWRVIISCPEGYENWDGVYYRHCHIEGTIGGKADTSLANLELFSSTQHNSNGDFFANYGTGNQPFHLYRRQGDGSFVSAGYNAVWSNYQCS